MKRIAVFVSGGGTNLQALLDACAAGVIPGQIVTVVGDNACFGLERGVKAGTATYLHDRKAYRAADSNGKKALEAKLLEHLTALGVELVVLAGYLSVIPSSLVKAYPERIINIHPALIPKYSGKGWYGDKIHEAVIRNQDRETGITVHFVDEGIDSGRIIEQVIIKVVPTDSVESLRYRVHASEYPLLTRTVKHLCETLE